MCPRVFPARFLNRSLPGAKTRSFIVSISINSILIRNFNLNWLSDCSAYCLSVETWVFFAVLFLVDDQDYQSVKSLIHSTEMSFETPFPSTSAILRFSILPTYFQLETRIFHQNSPSKAGKWQRNCAKRTLAREKARVRPASELRAPHLRAPLFHSSAVTKACTDIELLTKSHWQTYGRVVLY